MLAAFGETRGPVALPGGAGTSWRAGGVVLKPLDTSPQDLAWQRRVLTPLEGRDDVRVSAPLAAPGGALVVRGWTARRWLEGEPGVGRWDEVVRAGRLLHAAIAGGGRPAHLRARTDPWALAERAAWGEADVPSSLGDLASLRRPLDLPSQVVHGDLTGNVLLHDRLPPAVIDLSACWRPLGWATAVVVADALVWHGAPRTLVAELLDGPPGAQLLLRALLFRAIVDLSGSRGDDPSDWDRAVGVVRDLVG